MSKRKPRERPETGYSRGSWQRLIILIQVSFLRDYVHAGMASVCTGISAVCAGTKRKRRYSNRKCRYQLKAFIEFILMYQSSVFQPPALYNLKTPYSRHPGVIISMKEPSKNSFSTQPVFIKRARISLAFPLNVRLPSWISSSSPGTHSLSSSKEMRAEI